MKKIGQYRYFSDDGGIFDSKEDALEHEKIEKLFKIAQEAGLNNIDIVTLQEFGEAYHKEFKTRKFKKWLHKWLI